MMLQMRQQRCNKEWHTQEFCSHGGGVKVIQLRTERPGIWRQLNLVQEISFNIVKFS
jgi:hypothetical protein